MSEFTFQASYKTPYGSLINVRGEDSEEFARNLNEVDAMADEILATESALMGTPPLGAPAEPAEAMTTIRQDLAPVSTVGSTETFALGPLGTGANSPREDVLSSKGFVPDKWHTGPDTGGWWHPNKFPEAPPCTCSGPYKPNHGRLAYKYGISQSGKEYKAWTCVNTFGKGAKAGCPSTFQGTFPSL